MLDSNSLPISFDKLTLWQKRLLVAKFAHQLWPNWVLVITSIYSYIAGVLNRIFSIDGSTKSVTVILRTNRLASAIWTR